MPPKTPKSRVNKTMSISPPAVADHTTKPSLPDKNLVLEILLARLDAAKDMDWYQLSLSLSSTNSSDQDEHKGGKRKSPVMEKGVAKKKKEDDELDGTSLREMYYNRILPALKEGKAPWIEMPEEDVSSASEKDQPSPITEEVSEARSHQIGRKVVRKPKAEGPMEEDENNNNKSEIMTDGAHEDEVMKEDDLESEEGDLLEYEKKPKDQNKSEPGPVLVPIANVKIQPVKKPITRKLLGGKPKEPKRPPGLKTPKCVAGKPVLQFWKKDQNKGDKKNHESKSKAEVLLEMSEED